MVLTLGGIVMERKIAGIINMNIWLTIFLLINSALKTSYYSYDNLIERIILIILCIVGGIIIQKKISNIFYLNGFKNIYRATIIISLWWFILSLLFPNVVYYTSLSILFCLLFTFCLYQGIFYRKIDKEKFPFFSLLLPLIIIILTFLLLIYRKDYSRAIVTLFFLVCLYNSFKLKKIVMWRNIFIFVLSISVITIMIYVYNNRHLLTNFEPNYTLNPYFSLLGNGLGKSSIINNSNFTYNDINIVRLLIDEIGIFALICTNFTGIYLIITLHKLNKLIINSKESHRLLCKGIFWAFTLELIIFNLSVLGILPFSDATHPLLASNIDYLWWNLGLAMIRGLVLRTETLGQMSQTTIQGI